MIYLDDMQDKVQDKFNLKYGGKERGREREREREQVNNYKQYKINSFHIVPLTVIDIVWQTITGQITTGLYNTYKYVGCSIALILR